MTPQSRKDTREVLEPGTVLPHDYVIDSLLGQGGMGSVYLAHASKTPREAVAIKEMLIKATDTEIRAQAVRQSLQEAEILASLSHPNLVRVLDYFEHKDNQYLVMEYVDGRTLEGAVNMGSGFPPLPLVLDWADQLFDVLHYLHDQSPPIIFRDLKPSNIMLDYQGRIRLIDFGIARDLDLHTQAQSRLPAAGTPGFAPVEQYDGIIDGRTDIYALGATLYALLTFQVPPESPSLESGEAVLQPIHAVNPGIPPAIEDVIARMLAMNRSHRYPTMYKAWEAIRVAQRDLGIVLPKRQKSLGGMVGTETSGRMALKRVYEARSKTYEPPVKTPVIPTPWGIGLLVFFLGLVIDASYLRDPHASGLLDLINYPFYRLAWLMMSHKVLWAPLSSAALYLGIIAIFANAGFRRTPILGLSGIFWGFQTLVGMAARGLAPAVHRMEIVSAMRLCGLTGQTICLIAMALWLAWTFPAWNPPLTPQKPERQPG